MFKLFYFVLIIGLVSLVELSPVNNDQRHGFGTEKNSNGFSSTASSGQSTLLNSTKMQWLKVLKNFTENSGSTVKLECQVRSSYPVTFNWYRYNNPLEKYRFLIEPENFYSRILLKNVKDSEAGFYTCEVSNGFETVSSTGFVRVSNSGYTDSIDLNDDSLPSIEFQPEILVNPEANTNKYKCEIYSGSLCRSFVGSQLISVSQNQNEIERDLVEILSTLTKNRYLSSECHRWLLPMFCSLNFPLCDQEKMSPRTVCRRSCNYFQTKICPTLFSPEQLDVYPQVAQLFGSCENSAMINDESSCVYLDQIESHQRNGSSKTNRNEEISSSLPSTSLLTVLLSILVPVVTVALILIVFCWCCRQRNNNSQLSSCSSSSTPIKKSTHLVNTVTSSPFRASISAHHSKFAQRHLPSSSSSSANTNLTNAYLRQTLLRSEAKQRQTVLISPTNNSLTDVPFSNIRFLQELGEGEFGRIYKAELIDTETKCIIKTLQADQATAQTREEYAREIEIFRNIRHVNISCLIGICLQAPDAASLMIYERLNDGDLHEYLLQRSSTVSVHQRDLTDFLFIGIQIVSGMIYLAEKNFVHNDLSTKNILISEHMDIKISNVARYRPKYDHDYYKIANRALPVRWMAVESLLSGIYTELSDVWSFGVLLWEMFSYGTQPYQGRTNPEVIEMIRDRKLLSCPSHCPKLIYALMCSCWEELSEQRPTFTELMSRLRQLEDKTTTLSSTTSSSLAEVPPANHSNDLPKQIYRTFIPPPMVPIGGPTSFVRNDIFTSSGRTAPQSMTLERDSIRFNL